MREIKLDYVFSDGVKWSKEYEHESPLRAAMIVYLMMKEVAA